MNRNRKPFFVAACALLLALLLAGCMNAGNRTTDHPNEAEPSGVPYVGTAPEGTTTAAPTQQPVDERQGAQNAPVEPFDWKASVGQVQDRINQFSEIAESTVVVSGNTALVGVKFDPQYRGELTERIRQMIAGVVMSFDAQVQTVAVTAESEDVETVRELSEKMAQGDESAARTEMDKIIRNTTTLS